MYNAGELSRHHRVYAIDTIGDAGKSKAAYRNISDVRIEVLNTGHAMGVEQPDRVNALIHDFFGEGQTGP